MWQQFDVNVMVNGSRCKQYEHSGRKYVEAKDGSDWYFQIQNNYSGRVLAICSVDGLNVLTGEPATENDTGYVIDAYHSQKIKGFRFSDDEWALFKFGYKVNKDTGAKNEKVYAVSKGDGKEKNCGVIGVKLFYEVPKVIEYTPSTYTPYWGNCTGSSGGYAMSASWSGTANYATTGGLTSGTVNWSPTPSDRFNIQNMVEDYYIPVKESDSQTYDGPIACASAGTSTYYNSTLTGALADAKAKRITELANSKGGLMIPKSRGFDMGTEPGKREKSKVEIIDFERGCEAFSTDIYYASRDSLVEMGVPLSNNIKIGLPQSFTNKYCKMPEGWVGLL